MERESLFQWSKNVVSKDSLSRWLPPALYNQIRDLGRNQAKSESESSEDCAKSAQNLPKIWLVRPKVRPGQAAQAVMLRGEWRV